MERIEGWVRTLTGHVARHWLVHLAGFAAVLFAMMLLGFGLLAAYLLIFGGTMLFMAFELERVAMAVFFGLGALGSLVLGVAHLVAFGLWLGWVRIAALRERGLAADWRELGWPLRHPLRVLGFAFLAFSMVLLSAGLFYLPLVFLGPFFLLSAVPLAAGDRGLLGALGLGLRRAGRAYGWLLLVSAVCFIAALFLYCFPLVGPGLAVALVTTTAVAIHESLAREGAPER